METRVDIEKLNTSGKQEQKPFTEKQNVEVLYVDITHYSPRTQFIISCSAVFVLYILYGYLQELIFTQEGFKSYGWYLTLVQFTFYSFFAFIECVLTKTKRRISMKVYAFLAILTLGTMGFSNSSLNYLNYPTQVIFKCCKLIPVMIGSILIQKKKYKLIDFLAAVCMCIGLSLFTLADSQLSPNFNAIGVLMISSALVCDALIGNVQEKSMKSTGATNREVILYSYSIGHLYLTTIMLISGSLWSGILFCAEKTYIYGYAFLFSATGYLGVQVVLSLVRTCGALTAVTVTTSRKAVSIVVSFIFFAKPYSSQYFWAGSLVVLGIYLNLLSKNNNFSINWRSIEKLYFFVLNCFGKRRTKSIETTV